MSDGERSLSPPRHGNMSTRHSNRDGGVSPIKNRRGSRSRSRGASYRSRTPSPRRSRSKSRHRRNYSRSRSRSRSKRCRGRRYDSRSRSRSPRRRRHSRGRSRSPLSSHRRHVGNRENPPATRCLGVFGLSLYTQERDLREVFSKYGAVQEVQVVYDAQTGRSRGFSFVYFENVEDAQMAKERCNGLEVDGRRIRVDYSITQRAHTPTPGIYMGKPTHSSGGRSSSSSGPSYQSGGSRYVPYHRTPSPAYHGSSRRSRYSRSRSRSYTPRRY